MLCILTIPFKPGEENNMIICLPEELAGLDKTESNPKMMCTTHMKTNARVAPMSFCFVKFSTEMQILNKVLEP